MVAFLSVAPRVALAAGLLPSALQPFIAGDVLYTYDRGLQGGGWPYVDLPFEYPPLIGYLAGALAHLAPDRTAYVAAWGVVAMAVAAAVGVLVARERNAWRWALAPQLLLHAGTNFDLLAVAPFTAAIVLARRGRLFAAAASLGLGGAAKLFPLVALAPFVREAPRRALALGALAFAVFASFYLPTIAAQYSPLLGLRFYAVRIPANEASVWGLVSAAARAAGAVDPVPALVAITGIGLVVTFVLGVLPRARQGDPAIAMGSAVVALLLWSRLYSPQYSLWVAPLFALLPLPRGAFVMLGLGDVLVAASLYPMLLSGSGTEAWLLGVLGAGVILRQFALLRLWRDLGRRPPP